MAQIKENDYLVLDHVLLYVSAQSSPFVFQMYSRTHLLPISTVTFKDTLQRFPSIMCRLHQTSVL